MISPPCVEMRSLTFAVSMLVPPPTATNPSNSPSTAKSAASCSELSVGSTRALSQTSTSTPSASISSRMRGVMPAATTPGSETSITRLTPIRLTSQPTSSAAPGPYFRGVASIVKMVSRSLPCMAEAPPFPRETCLSPQSTLLCRPIYVRTRPAASRSVGARRGGMCRGHIPPVFQYNHEESRSSGHLVRLASVQGQESGSGRGGFRFDGRETARGRAGSVGALEAVVRGWLQGVGGYAARAARELPGPVRPVRTVVRGHGEHAGTDDGRGRRHGGFRRRRPAGVVAQVVRRDRGVLGEVRGARPGGAGYNPALGGDARPGAGQPDERGQLPEGPARVRRPVVQRHQRPILR